MNSFYEEIIPLKDLKPEQDANKYFISEELTEVERINFVFKKGNITQKCAYINRLPDMLGNIEVFKMFIEHTIENTDMWKSQLLIAFADALNKSIIKMTKLKTQNELKNYTILINKVIKFFITTITTEAKEICDEFLKNFYDMVEVLNKGFRLDIDRDIIDLATSLGSFSNPSILRRYSAYFCSSLIRIENKTNHNENLLKRFIILSSDPELPVRLEIAYHIRFVLEELDEIAVKKHFIKIFDEYITENDIIARSEFLISLVLNIDKIVGIEYIQKLITKILNFIDNDYNADKNFPSVCKVFRTIVLHLQNFPQYQKFFIDLIKVFLKKYFMLFEKDIANGIENNFSYDYLIEDFHLISKILRRHNENNFWTDLFNYLIRQIFENLSYQNEINPDVSQNTIKSNVHKDYKLIFFKNFDKILEFINKQLFNKHLLEEFFRIFLENETEYLTAVIKNLKAIFEFQILTDNQEFFTHLVKNFDTFTNEICKIKIWRLQSEALNAIELVLENLHKQSNNTTFNSTTEDFSLKLFNFIKFFIDYDNFQIQTVAISLLAKNLRHSKNKEEIIKYTQSEMFENKNFYKRRLYLIFFHNALKNFSINYINEIGLLQNIFNFFDDTSINICHLISIIPDFYPLLNDMNEIKFKLLSRLTELRKNAKCKEDREIIRVLNNFTEWEDYYRKNKENENFKEIVSADKLKFDEELKRQSQAKLATDMKDKRNDQKRKRSTITKKPITNTTKTNMDSINHNVLNKNWNHNSVLAVTNNLRVNNARKSIVRKDSKKSNLINFPVINRSDNKKYSVQENKTPDLTALKSKLILEKKSLSSSLKLKGNDDKYLIDEYNNKNNLSSKEVIYKVKISAFSPTRLSQPISKYHSNNKLEPLKNQFNSNFSLKEPMVANNYLSINHNSNPPKIRSDTKIRSNTLIQTYTYKY